MPFEGDLPVFRGAFRWGFGLAFQVLCQIPGMTNAKVEVFPFVQTQRPKVTLRNNEGQKLVP